ncbi:H/ACA ribonucleoprotein complex non-core subunit NAF1 isoform X2 [Hoplias malabaricus]|uniref:H/ACA ribonucleoprotein complex non-core subunit NAF1 isoform X2 n=1 Tax=Hoplias malabaricus TaxID=27720 RepID=UPI0034634610
MESLHTENLISTQLQVNESTQDDYWIPAEKESNSPIIQMNDVAPGLAAFEATTQLSEEMDVKVPHEYEKTKESSEFIFTETSALHLGTGDNTKQSSEPILIKQPEDHQKVEDSSAANIFTDTSAAQNKTSVPDLCSSQVTTLFSEPVDGKQPKVDEKVVLGDVNRSKTVEPLEMNPFLNEDMDIKIPNEHEKPRLEMNNISEMGGKESHNIVISDTGTAEIAPELSNGMDAKLPKSHEKRKESEINITESTALQRQPEVPYQLGEDMELSVPDHLRILQSPPQMHEQVNQRISDHEGEPCPVSQNMAVNKVTMTPVSGGGGSLDLLRMQYREDSSGDHFDSDSDDSSSTSSSSSSSSSGVNSFLMNELDQDENQEGGLSLGKGLLPMRTQDELLIEDLPAVENLNISLSEETEMESIGVISSIIDKLVIVESKKDTLPLNEGTVFFSKERIAIGKVFEVFGPVCQPYYILRFNSQEDIDQKNLKQGESVFFAPQVKDFTEYIFTEQLNEIKGSDASWKNDQEPPPEALDFSDDEQERLAKQKLKKQKRHQRQQLCEEKCDSESETPTCTPQMTPRRKSQNQNFERKRHVHHNPQNFGHSSFHGNPHFQPQDTPQFYSQCGPYFQPQGSLNFQRQGNAPFQHQGSPHFQPNYILPTPESFHLPYHATNFPPYPPPGPNPPHIGMGPIAPGPYLGMMFHLPPPPPPPPPGN